MQREDILEKVRLYRRGKGSHYQAKMNPDLKQRIDAEAVYV